MNSQQSIYSSFQVLNSRPRQMLYNVCIDIPPKIYSDGLWASETNGLSPFKSLATLLEMQIIFIFIITRLSHFILKRFGCPLFVSQMLAGIILGPSLKIEGLDKYKKGLFPFGSEQILAPISTIGYTLFMFVNFVQMDFSMITRSGKKAWVIGFSSLITPIVFGYSIINIFKLGDKQQDLPIVFITHSISSFPVICSFLNDLKIVNSELGRLALSSALVSDIIGSTFQGIATAVIDARLGIGNYLMNVFSFVAYIIMIPLIFRPAMMWVVKQTPEGRPVKKIYTYSIILLVLILGMIASAINQPFFAGAMVLGLAVPEGPPLGSALVDLVNLFATSYFLPIFVTTSVMKADLHVSYGASLVMTVCFLVVMVHFVKICVCMGIYLYCKIPSKDAFVLALIMNCKGVVELCQLTLLYDSLRLSDQLAGLTLLSVLIPASVVRIGVKSLYDQSRKYAGYQHRNIMNTKHSSALRIVACTHKPNDIVAIKNVLDFCCPTAKQPINVHVLHLMELIGRSSPVFISHRLQEKVRSNYHFSEDVVVTFDLYQQHKRGAAEVNTYTAVSPVSLMHEDVTHLALDKLASIIILPFHVKYGGDGSIEAKDSNIRSLNCKVLEKSPCSVGILVSRGYHHSSNSSSLSGDSSTQIAVIFLGGEDDREALCLARRATTESNMKLVVYHLVTEEQPEQPNWDFMLDSEMLRDVKGKDNVVYEKIVTEDASATSCFISGMADKYDFIIVGRRHGIKSQQTHGLLDWGEFPELGAVGDLLASTDMETKASVLVVQQQVVYK